MSQITNSESNSVVFLAEWDETLGPTVKDSLNISQKIGDIDIIALNIFSSFQMVFGDSTEVSFKRTKLTMPLKSRNSIARIFFDVVPTPGSSVE